MKANIFIAALIPALVFGVAMVAHVQMESDNYGIQSSVQSGGGTTAASANYQMNSTIGQPSPIPDPSDPPFSDAYDLYPGFWYVIAALESICSGDFNGDKDVDGSDLAKYIFNTGGLGLDQFAVSFGKENCP